MYAGGAASDGGCASILQIRRTVNFSAAKAGILGLTKAAAKELARHNIRVKAAQSGLIRTAMTESMRRERLGAADRRDHAVPCR